MTAVVAALVPVLFSALRDGFPTLVEMVGFILALVAVWLISWSDHEKRLRVVDLRLPASAGLGFGVFLILIDQVSKNAIMWPLVSARFSSIMVLLVLGLLNRNYIMPVFNQLPIIALAGIFDTSGNVFYALATKAGRLDLAAVLGSLYPAVTVMLAWMILKERLTLRQWIGVLFALVAIILISV